MANQSGEFTVPGAGYRAWPQAVAFFNQQLWVIGGRDQTPGPLVFSTLSVSSGGKTLTLPDEAKLNANWTPSAALTIPGTPSGPTTSARCSAAPLGAALFLFWSNFTYWASPRSVLMASRYGSTGPDALKWGAALTLQDTAGVALNPWTLNSSGDVSATPFGDDTIIVAAACLRKLEDYSTQHLYIGAFNVADINLDNHTWKAQNEVRIPVGKIDPKATAGYINAKFTISVDWFNGSTGPTGTPPYWLWIALAPITDANRATFCLPLDAKGNPTPAGDPHVFADYRPFGNFVVRDPAGRIRSYLNEYISSQFTIYSHNTCRVVRSDDWQSPLPFIRDTLPTISNDGASPTVAFFTDLSRGADVTFKGKTGKAFPVWEFIIYPASSVKAQINLLGYAQVFPEFASLLPKPPLDTTRYVIAGIIDGPIPVPNVNFIGATFQSTQPDFGVVTYSSKDSTSTTHKVSYSWTAGIRTDGGVTKGAGPAWDIAVNGGTAYTNGTIDTTSTSTSRTQDSLLEIVEKPEDPKKMLPLGTVYCSEARIHVTAYRFVDPDHKPINDGTVDSPDNQSPLFVSLQTVFTDSGALAFEPYAVTPGDITSYTPEKLNARMKALGYPGDHYFEDVVVPNAYTFGSGDNAQNYLQYDWASSGGDATSFEATHDEFAEQGWSLNASVYIGVSGGEEVSILGFGEAASFKFLVGGTFSMSANTTVDTTDGWGIGITPGNEGRIGPPYPTGAGADPGRMTSYTFRLYYLPPPGPTSKLTPNYWVQELQNYASKAPPRPGLPPLDPHDIDPNAQAWKIMYVVTHWASFNGGSYTYPT